MTVVEAQLETFVAEVVDTVVADHRSREADELLREARVGDDLLVAGHPSREHRFAAREPLRADRLAAEDVAVLERQETRHE